MLARYWIEENGDEKDGIWRYGVIVQEKRSVAVLHIPSPREVAVGVFAYSQKMVQRSCWTTRQKESHMVLERHHQDL